MVMKNSYSQHGQDMILNDLFRNYNKGFYVDIGCNNPINQSNTFFLYNQGWNGIGIDAEKIFIDEWKEHRSRDIFINALLSNKPEKLDFYKFSDNTASTADNETMLRYKTHFGEPVETKSMNTVTLERILVEYDVSNDFELLCIDVEGVDLKVLESFDINIYRPKVILIEMKLFNFTSVSASKIFNYLNENNYSMIAKTPLDGFFVDRHQDLGWIPKELLSNNIIY